MRNFFKGLQAASAALAGAIVVNPGAVAPFIPPKYQPQVAGVLALLGAVLPSIAPRAVRGLWGGGQGGQTPPAGV